MQSFLLQESLNVSCASYYVPFKFSGQKNTFKEHTHSNDVKY